MRSRYGLIIAAALGFTACSKGGAAEMTPEPAAVPTLMAKVVDAQGHVVARVSVRERGKDSVAVTVDATDTLPAGVHGIHLHAVGKCEPLTFASAGPHLNPNAKKHGLKNPEGAHAGDMQNFAGGHVVLIAAATWAQLTDADGTAIVIHAGPDDEVTDPSGNSGARIACGVLEGMTYWRGTGGR